MFTVAWLVLGAVAFVVSVRVEGGQASQTLALIGLGSYIMAAANLIADAISRSRK